MSVNVQLVDDLLLEMLDMLNPIHFVRIEDKALEPLQESFIQAHLATVFNIAAQTYRDCENHSLSLMDIFQAGSLGLVRAVREQVEGVDEILPDESFTVSCIKQTIYDYLKKEFIFQAVNNQYVQNKTKANRSPDNVFSDPSSNFARAFPSIEKLATGSPFEQQLVAKLRHGLESYYAHQELKKRLNHLPPREMLVIWLRYLQPSQEEGWTHTEIAKLLDVPAQVVLLIEERALAQLNRK